MIQSPAAWRCQVTAALVLMSRVRARMAAGISAASWNRAVLRSGPGRMPSALQPAGQPVGADRPAGLASGEQPGRWLPGSDGRLALAVGQHGAGDRGGRLGQVDRNAAEAETDAVVAGLDLAGGHLADRGHALGVEKDEQAGEAVLGPDGAVMQEPACGVPAVLVIGQLGGPVPWAAVRWPAVSLLARAQRISRPASSR